MENDTGLAGEFLAARPACRRKSLNNATLGMLAAGLDLHLMDCL